MSKYFDIEKDYSYKNLDIDLFAKSFVRNERYFASKKVTVYAFENNEYSFAKKYERLEKSQLDQFMDTLKSAADDFIDPSGEHMSTVINGIVIVEEGLDENFKNNIEKFKFDRSFAFGFKGWTYIRLIVVDLKKGEVITNKRGKEVKKFYQVG